MIRNNLLVFSCVMLAGCASNEQLFARYDALCHQGICVAAQPTEVFYQPVQMGMTWEPAVYFGYDLDYLQESELARLDQNLKVLMAHDELKLSLQGFTDSIASLGYNLDLSTRRVEAVADYLRQNGLSESRILMSRAGEMLPVIDNDSVETRIINRRVEMMLLDAEGRPLSVGIDPDAASEDDFVPPVPAQKVD